MQVITKPSGLLFAIALVPCNLDQLTSTCINSIKGYYSKFLEREGKNLDVEVDKWTIFYNKVPVDSRPQDVCTALDACDPNYFPAINIIFVIFVQPQLVVLHVKDHFRHFAD